MKQTRHDSSEFLAEILVHTGVEKRVVNGRAHSYDVRDEEKHGGVGFLMEVGPVFDHHVHAVQR